MTSRGEDVLAAAKGLAGRQNKTVGGVISALSRQALGPKSASAKVRNGVPLLAVSVGSVPVTPKLLNQLRDELP
jgi:hypothetical protein